MVTIQIINGGVALKSYLEMKNINECTEAVNTYSISRCKNPYDDLSPSSNTNGVVEVKSKNPGVKHFIKSKTCKVDKFVKNGDGMIDELIEESNKNSSASKIHSDYFSRKRKMLCPSVVDVLLKRNKLKLSSSVSNSIHTNSHQIKVNGFGIGDMVWAKIGKYPVWPGIIISDPESNTFAKKENTVIMLHIYYCNDAYKRNWIRMNQIFKFSSKKTILNEFPKIITQISRSKLKIKWNRAVDEAEVLAAMNKDNRIDAFFANNFLPHISVQSLHDSKINNLKSKTKVQASLNNTSQKELSSTQDLISVESTNLMFIHSDNQIESNREPEILTQTFPKDHPRILIPELSKLFYSNGWITGTVGGISIKYNGQIFISPSGVQKERMEPEDLFVQDKNGVDIQVPPIEKNLSKSLCTPIFMCSYNERNAGAVFHVISPEVVKLCLLNPENELRVSGLEMVKGIYNEKKGKFYDNDEEVVIPIIGNSKYERDLVVTFKMALKKYPSTSAVLVRNHGMYVWGKDWKSAKTQCECYEYLFNIWVFKKTHNL